MLLIDALNVIETVGGILLAISGIAFILLGVVVEIRQKSAAAEDPGRRGELVDSGDPSAHSRQLDLVAKTKKRPVFHKAPGRKAA